MKTDHPTILRVLQGFLGDELDEACVTPLPGGLSGSEVWKIDCRAASYCLKNMPEGYQVNQLLTVHQVCRQRRKQGLSYLPHFQSTLAGPTYLEEAGRLWELQDWKEGTPPTVPPEKRQLRRMFQAIAEFHQSAWQPEGAAERRSPSPGAVRRLALVQRWRRRSYGEMLAELNQFGSPQLAELLRPSLDSFQRYADALQRRLESVAALGVASEVCIGDPRPENFLFSEQRLSGLIDLASLRTDSIALDVARLAGEVGVTGPSDWEQIWDALSDIRPLTHPEMRLAQILELSNILLIGLQWFDFLVWQGRTFADWNQVEARLHHQQGRLANVADHPGWIA